MSVFERLRDWSSFEWLTLAFVLALVVLPFSCIRRSPEPGKAVLRIWTAADPEQFQKARKEMDEYEAAHPGVEIRLEQIAGDMANKYLSAMQAGNCADVFWLHWSMLPSYASKGALLPLDEFCKADNFDMDDFFSSMVEAYRYKGKLYAMPHQGSTQMLIYNKDLFDKAGLKYPDENWTRDDFLEAAKKLTVRDEQGRAVQVGCLPGDWSSWVWSAGGELASDDLAEFRFSDPKTVDGLRFYIDLRNKWKVTTRDMTVRGEDPTKVDSFDTGRIGMQVTGPWVLDGYSKTLKFRWGVSVFPKGPGGRQTRFAGGSMAIWSGSRNKRAAWDYVKYVVSREAGERDLSGYTEVPARRSLACGVFSRKQFPCDAKVILDSVDPRFSTVRVWPRSEKWGALRELVNGQLELALMGTVTLEEALRAIEKRGHAAMGHAGSGQPTVAGYRVGWIDYAGVSAIVGGLLAVMVARGRRTLAKSRALSTGARRSNLGYLFLAPNAIGFFAFTLVPLIASLVLAFTDWQMLRPHVRFVGLANFATLLGFHQGPGGWTPNDRDFWYFVYNTLFLMLGIPLSMAASLFLAILVNNKIRGIVAFRALFYLPSLCAGVALLMLWRLMYHADHGLMNKALAWIGVEGPNWLQSVAWAKPALMLMGIWTGAGGGSMIIYLAGLQGIPPELYEAAHIDGAGWWARFRNVTWPMLAPTTFFIFTMSIIGGFQGGFNAAYIMTSGGPAGSTTTIAYHIYNVAYTGELLMGYGCAIAWVLFVLVFAVTMLNWRYGGKSATEGWQQ